MEIATQEEFSYVGIGFIFQMVFSVGGRVLTWTVYKGMKIIAINKLETLLERRS
jgi:hypothetical protein